MDFEAKFIFSVCAFSLYVAIYIVRIMPVLQENDEFNEHRFWFSFFYIFESAARYYEICKARNLPLGWFHVYQINFILWCLLLIF